MAYSQNFSDHLLRQLNESNRRNLELQSLLAHKDDQLAGANAQLQRAVATATAHAQPLLVQNLQKRNNDFQGQLKYAKQATADAQWKLNDRTKDFNAVHTQQQQRIHALEQKLDLKGCAIKDTLQLNGMTKADSLEKDLTKANAELQRMRTAYSSLQRQFGAEKKRSDQSQSFPATARGKSTKVRQGDNDVDDEELNASWIKQETGNVSMSTATSKPPSLSSKKTMLQPSIPSTRLQPATKAQSSRRTSSSSNITLASRPKAVKPIKKIVCVTAPSSQPKIKKRRRSHQSELEDELEDLEVASPIRHKRTCRSIGSNIDVDTSSIREKFHFKAITDYEPDGGIHYFQSTDAEDIVDDCQIWDDVKLVVDGWEEAKGEFWAYEFEDKMRGRAARCCDSSKLKVEGRSTGRTNWRPGGEGLYACGKCVDEGKPCFTWDGEGFRLLPLHKEIGMLGGRLERGLR